LGYASVEGGPEKRRKLVRVPRHRLTYGAQVSSPVVTQANQRGWRKIPMRCIDDDAACCKGKPMLRRDLRRYVRFHINRHGAGQVMKPTLFAGLCDWSIGSQDIACHRPWKPGE
jgi:hypothetical protein